MSSIREVKAAKIKLSILQATKELIGRKSFKDLYVLDVCEKVNISKVTLFKYFPQKEDILLYYLRIWCFQIAVNLKKNAIDGVDGVHYLTDRIADEYSRYPGIWLNLIGHLAAMNHVVKPFPVKEVEKKLLYPQVEDIKSVEIKSIEQMLEGFLLEAIFRGEIVKNTHSSDLCELMMSLIYGIILTAHTHSGKSAKLFFRNNIDIVLRGLK